MQLAYKKAAQLLKDGETLETIAYETKKRPDFPVQ